MSSHWRFESIIVVGCPSCYWGWGLWKYCGWGVP